MFIKTAFFLYFVTLFVSFIEANDVLGCGGFIKSHVPIDFSKIEVKLLTKGGVVKDSTNGAPNSGYYFLPLYDGEDFVEVQVNPPFGWSFSPKSVPVHINGEDMCSNGEDINFVFQGFGIAGKVESLGSSSGGPEGVPVELKSSENTITTTTSKGGLFSFSPVYPGLNVISISSSNKWKVFKGSLEVKVTEGNTELPANTLVIQGYDVKGSISTADGKAVPNAIIALYGQETKNKNVLVEECQKRPPPGLQVEDKFLCYVKSNSKGEFLFPVVPVGSYFVSPHYNEENIYYHPEKIEFSVQHGSVKLESFQIVGYTIPGRVVDHKNNPISGANILLNGKKATKSDSTGKYKLEKLKVGNYRVKAEAENFLFDEIAVSVNSELGELPPLRPKAYKVCGKVLSHKPQVVTFTRVGTTSVLKAVTEDKEFCIFALPEVYDVTVEVESRDQQSGLQFFPISQRIDVVNSNTKDIVFSQLKSKVLGTVNCIQKQDCIGLNIILTSDIHELVIPVTDSSYVEKDVLPGVYDITISQNNLCWKFTKQSININKETVEIPPFIQTGYQLEFVSAHEATITYNIEKKRIQASISEGLTSVCVDRPGEYSFKIESCHEFAHNPIKYKVPSEDGTIYLRAIRHTLEVSIESKQYHGPVTLLYHSAKFSKEAFVETTFDNGLYKAKLMLEPGDNVTLTPSSKILFFTPNVFQVDSKDDCSRFERAFTGVPGKVFEGLVQPPIVGVSINLKGGEVDLTALTDTKGRYSFLPVDGRQEYNVSASKDGYIFDGPNDKGNFVALKLAEIRVKIVDETLNGPLEGALLSLSGGQNFRKNLQTDEHGQCIFMNLKAMDYFIRPMMKEFKFEPASKIIALKEGEVIEVVLKAKRIAFSAFGIILSVSGEPVENVKVLAAGQLNCTGKNEEARTNAGGLFRVRGLEPNCPYSVKAQFESGSLDQRISPESFSIESVKRDVREINFTHFEPPLYTNVVLKLFSAQIEHYRSLNVIVYREGYNSERIYSISLENFNVKAPPKRRNRGILLSIPPVRFGDDEYSVHLEHSKGKGQVSRFRSNENFKLVEINFSPKTLSNEPQIKRTSVWALALIVSVAFFIYNIQSVTVFLNKHLHSFVNIEKFSLYSMQRRNSNGIKNINYDNEIDQIVEDINNVRKHKVKKS